MNPQDLISGQSRELSSEEAIGALQTRWAGLQKKDFGSDIDVLNYALTLEYLESTFYDQGNKKGLLSGQAKAYLEGVQKDENDHVKAVKSTIQKLGGTPVSPPKVDFDDAFASKEKYLTTSFTFENVGVSAYLGAAGFIKHDSVLQAAAGIYSVECRHAAIVANLLGKPVKNGVFMGATETPKTKSEVLKAVSPYIVSGNKNKKNGGGMVMPNGSVNTGGGGTSGDGLNTAAMAAGGAMVAGAGAALYGRHRAAGSGESGE
jgi:rubrerythrin